jgi:hypothetical protein
MSTTTLLSRSTIVFFSEAAAAGVDGRNTYYRQFLIHAFRLYFEKAMRDIARLLPVSSPNLRHELIVELFDLFYIYSKVVDSVKTS